MITQVVVSAASFLSTIGVNVHLEYTDGGYANVPGVISDLNYLGVSHVRDGSLYSQNQGQNAYAQVAAAGVKFNMVVYGFDLQTHLNELTAWVAAHPGAVEAVEGPNEVNNWPVSYNGLSGTAGAVAFQAALYAGLKADAHTANIPVYNLTSWPDIAAKADYANFHSYPGAGDQPLARLAADLAGQKAAMPGLPAVLTEAGYYSLPGGGTWGGVDLDTQAKLTLNLLFDAAKLGVQRTYLYQLLDAYADPSNTDMEKHFGLFDINNNPKPVAKAIHNLTTILADPGAGVAGGGSLSYNASGLPSTGSVTVLQKSSGAYDLVVWNEPDIWNEASHTAIAAAPTSVGFDFAGKFSTISVYDPMVGSAPIATASNASHIDVSVVDHPLIIEVSGPVVEAPPVVTPPVVVAPPATTTTDPTPPASSEVTAPPPVTVTPPVSTEVPSAPPTAPLTNTADTPAPPAKLLDVAAAYQAVMRLDAGGAADWVSSMASQLTSGGVTKAAALDQLIDLASSTTAVAVSTYQFFSGSAPTAAGLDYLVNSAANGADLNDSYYRGFNLENRYINFAANLGLHGSGASGFASVYGGLNFNQSVELAYEVIVGSGAARAASLDPQAAITFVESRVGYFQQIAHERMPAENQDLATKAAMVGFLLQESVRGDVGLYGHAVHAFLEDVAYGQAHYNVDIVGTYTGAATADWA